MNGPALAAIVSAILVGAWDLSLVLRRRRCVKCWRPFGIFTGKLCRRCWR